MKKKNHDCRDVAVREYAKNLKHTHLDFETRLWLAKNFFDEIEGKPINQKMLITRYPDGTVTHEEVPEAKRNQNQAQPDL